MKKYEVNELEQIERPYEIDYSSLKSSKNESLKVKVNKLKEINNNLSAIKNNTNKINRKKNLVRNELNLNSINSFKTFSNDGGNYKNFRLNENAKKKLVHYIELNKGKLPKKKSLNKNNNKKGRTDKNSNNKINIYSKINTYWENREKQNKIKMQKIKKEREQKIYGELFPKPKISKNTKEIIERLKERNYEITSEDEKEDEINRNIPIRTKEKNYFFKTVYYSNKNKLKNKNQKPLNKSVSKINSCYKIQQQNKIQTSYKKRAKTPTLKKYMTSKKQKSSNKKKLNLSVTDIKNLEKIKQIRKNEEDENKKEIEEKIREENENSSNEQRNEIINSKEINDNTDKINMDRSMNIMSMRNNSINLNYISNINEIMTSRKYLNEIYNRDKKIINHSFYLNSATNPNLSEVKKINISSRDNNISNAQKSKNFDNKKKQRIKSENIRKKNRNKNSIKYGLYNPESKSMRYIHYTDISKSYNANIINNNYNEEERKNDNYFKNKNNSLIIKSDDRISEKKDGLVNRNKIKNNLLFEFDREIEEKNNEVNQLYKKELKYKTNEIHKIEVELNQRNKINKELIKESNVDDKDFEKIISKNESLNNKFNELDSKSLLKFREENLKKLQELRTKGNKCGRRVVSNMEEEKNMDNYDKQDKMKIKTMKYNSVLNSAQLNIENNLELYNNELKINEEKKKALLNKIYGNVYKKNISLDEIEEDNNNESLFRVNKYLVKNDFKENIFKYSSHKNNEDLNEKNEDIVGNFAFERKHHF